MTPKRFFYVMCGVNVFLVLVIFAGVYLATGMINAQAEKLSKAKAKYEATEQLQDQLVRAKKDVEQYTELNEIAKSIVPQDKDQAKTVFEIKKVADESGVPIKGILFDTSNLGQAPPPTAAKTEGDESTTETKPATPAAPSITQVKPVDGIKGVFGLQITVSSQENDPIEFENLISFLQKLEANRRTAHVESISIKPDVEAGGLSFNITLKAYVKP